MYRVRAQCTNPLYDLGVLVLFSFLFEASKVLGWTAKKKSWLPPQGMESTIIGIWMYLIFHRFHGARCMLHLLDRGRVWRCCEQHSHTCPDRRLWGAKHWMLTKWKAWMKKLCELAQPSEVGGASHLHVVQAVDSESVQGAFPSLVKQRDFFLLSSSAFLRSLSWPVLSLGTSLSRDPGIKKILGLVTCNVQVMSSHVKCWFGGGSTLPNSEFELYPMSVLQRVYHIYILHTLWQRWRITSLAVGFSVSRAGRSCWLGAFPYSSRSLPL